MKNSYTLNELLESESFQQYVRQPESQDAELWKQWLAQNPEQKEIVEQARQVIIGINFKRSSLSQEEIEQAWNTVNHQIQKHQHPNPSSQQNFYHAIAATVSLLIVAAASWWVFSASYQIDIQTAYGETKSLRLADGSEVTLNANSRLRFDARDLNSPERIVALGGEAYFHVVQKNVDSIQYSFSVNTDEGGTIEVLGTSFNVQSRRDLTQVVLESGKVKFKTEKEATTLIPGEMVEYSKATQEVSKKNVHAEMYSAWKDQKLFFDDTPLSTIAIVLEDTYGLQVVFGEEQLKNRKISGAVTAKNLNTLLQAMERLFKISITRQDNTLYFDSYEP
ncbi:FecR domain-containing protein [Catalinimonas sp. 4WD22]|uniref:FecR family protein n=1 Tax=Catalinimonas locisalis TaxID=3133978 RepID=UPI0031015F5B